jgi:hypothetical protein
MKIEWPRRMPRVLLEAAPHQPAAADEGAELDEGDAARRWPGSGRPSSTRSQVPVTRTMKPRITHRKSEEDPDPDEDQVPVFEMRWVLCARGPRQASDLATSSLSKGELHSRVADAMAPKPSSRRPPRGWPASATSGSPPTSTPGRPRSPSASCSTRARSTRSGRSTTGRRRRTGWSRSGSAASPSPPPSSPARGSEHEIHLIDTPGPRGLHRRGRALPAGAGRRGGGVLRGRRRGAPVGDRLAAGDSNTGCRGLAFVNKMDRDRGGVRSKVVREMRQKLHANPVPIQLPIGSRGQASAASSTWWRWRSRHLHAANTARSPSAARCLRSPAAFEGEEGRRSGGLMLEAVRGSSTTTVAELPTSVARPGRRRRSSDGRSLRRGVIENKHAAGACAGRRCAIKRRAAAARRGGRLPALAAWTCRR